MKRYVVTQYGVEEIRYERQFVVEISDEVDEEKLDDRVLAEMADKAGIEWSTDDPSGADSTHHDIEASAEELLCDHLVVVRYPIGGRRRNR